MIGYNKNLLKAERGQIGMTKADDKQLSKSQILSVLAEKTGLKKVQVGQLLDELAVLAYDEAKEKVKGFTLPGFGKLVVVDRAARTSRNPRTGETIQVPAKKTVKFRLAKAVKDSLLD
jgi:DNA-binding protein HU-beta